MGYITADGKYAWIPTKGSTIYYKKKKKKTTSNHKPRQAKDYQNVPVLNASLHWPVATVLLLAQECLKLMLFIGGWSV